MSIQPSSQVSFRSKESPKSLHRFNFKPLPYLSVSLSTRFFSNVTRPQAHTFCRHKLESWLSDWKGIVSEDGERERTGKRQLLVCESNVDIYTARKLQARRIIPAMSIGEGIVNCLFSLPNNDNYAICSIVVSFIFHEDSPSWRRTGWRAIQKICQHLVGTGFCLMHLFTLCYFVGK